MPKAQWRCAFYPDYCNTLEHKDARNKDCGMKGKTKSEKDAAKKVMLDKVVEQEMKVLSQSGKDFYGNKKETFILFMTN